jgi:hypothetical protein
VSFRQAYVTPSSLPEVTPKNRPKWNTILDERKGKRMSKNKHSAQFCHNRVREPNEPQPRFSALVRRNTKSTIDKWLILQYPIRTILGAPRRPAELAPRLGPNRPA